MPRRPRRGRFFYVALVAFCLAWAGLVHAAAPAAPTGLQAGTAINASGGPSVINLWWEANTETDFASYRVYRATSTDGAIVGSTWTVQIATITSSLTIAQEVGLTNGVTYYYVVAGRSIYDEDGPASTQVSTRPAGGAVNAAPGMSVGLGVADVTGDQGGALRLSWTANTEGDLRDYVLAQSSFASGPVTTKTRVAVIAAPGTTHQASALITTTYYFQIIARDTNLNGSAAGAEASAFAADNLAPSSPTAFGVAVPIPGDSLMNVSWTANTEADLQDYRLYRSTNAGVTLVSSQTVTIILPPGTTHQAAALSNGVTYYWRVTARDVNLQESLPATEVSAVAVDTTTPGTPTGFSVVEATPAAQGRGLRLSWTGNTEPDVKAYLVYRSTNVGVTQVSSHTILTVGTARATDWAVVVNQRYYYRVSVRDVNQNESGLSTESSGLAALSATDSTAPAGIATVTALSGANSGELSLSWTATGDDGAVGTALRYHVRSATFGPASFGNIPGDWWAAASIYAQSWVPKVSGAAESYTLAGLQEGATLWVSVVAEDECGNRSPVALTSISQVTVPAVYPSPPTVTATAGDKGGRITLSFTHVGDDGMSGLVTTYLLYRSTFAGGAVAIGSAVTTVQSSTATGSLLPRTPGTADSYSATNLTPGATYYFRLEARDEAALATLSAAEVSAAARQDDTLPGAITNLTTAVGGRDGEVDLTWVYPPDQDSTLPGAFIVRYATWPFQVLNAAHLAATTLGPVATPQFSLMNGTAFSTQTVTVTGLERRKQYYFAVRSSDTAGRWQAGRAGNLSDVVVVAPGVAADGVGPDAPLIVSLVALGPGGGRVQLSWIAPSSDPGVSTSPAVARYEIKYGTYGAVSTVTWWMNGEGAALLGYDRWTTGSAPGATETQVISGLAGPATAYWFAVRAYDATGSSGAISGVSSSPVVGNDLLSPSAIIDLTGTRSMTGNAVKLSWTDPVDPNSNPAAYAIKYTTVALSPDLTGWWNGSISSIPVTVYASTWVPVAGMATSQELTPMPTQTLYILIRTSDAANNVSSFSNGLTVLADATPPASIVDLKVSSNSYNAVRAGLGVNASASPRTGRVELTWTEPGDSGTVGQVAEVRVRWSPTAFIVTEADWNAARPSTMEAGAIAPTPLTPLAGQSFVVTTGLTVGTTYYFSVRGVDQAGSLGPISTGTITWCRPNEITPISYLVTLDTAGIPRHLNEWYVVAPASITNGQNGTSGVIADGSGRSIQFKHPSSSFLGGGNVTKFGVAILGAAGQITHTAGQIALDNIAALEQGVYQPGFALPIPLERGTSQMLAGSTDLTDLNNPERNEGTLVAFRGVRGVQVSTNTWPKSNTDQNYSVTDDTGGAGSEIIIRFAGGEQSAGRVAPPDPGVRFDVIGTQGQFDTTSPYFSGYQVFPPTQPVAGISKNLGIIERPRGLSALPGNLKVMLTWSSVTDPDRNGFEIYHSTAFPNPTWVHNQSISSAAATQATVVSGLTAGTTYYFYLGMNQVVNTSWAAATSAGGAFIRSGSPMANGLTIGEVAWVGFGGAGDTVAPSSPTAISALPSGSTEGGIDLSWTAPGDDDGAPPSGTATKYLIRFATFSPAANTTAWWEGTAVPPTGARPVELYRNPPAPKIYNSPEVMTLSGLKPGQLYYIAMRAVDEAGNVSTLSSIASATAANLAPPAPLGLTGIALDKAVLLTWKEPSLVGQFGEAIPVADLAVGSYRVYYNKGRTGDRSTRGSSGGTGCYDSVIPQASVAAVISVVGSSRTYTISGLENGSTYYMTVAAVDSAGNEGTPSNELAMGPGALQRVLVTEVGLMGPGDLPWSYSASGGADQFIEIYNAENVPVDINHWAITTRSMSSSLNRNFAKALIPPGTVLQPKQHYVIAYVEYGGKYRAGTREGILYPLADYDSGDPENTDAVNEKPSGTWSATDPDAPPKNNVTTRLGASVNIVTKAGFDLGIVQYSAASQSWFVSPDGMAGAPVTDRFAWRETNDADTSHNQNNVNSDGTWPDANGKYFMGTTDGNYDNTFWYPGNGAGLPSYWTLTLQRKDDDVDNNRLDDWRIARANPGTSADAVPPAKIQDVVASGTDTSDSVVDGVEMGIKLTFTAVGDDGTLAGSFGRANGYIVNYATWSPMNPTDLAAWKVTMSTYTTTLSPVRALYLSGTNLNTVSWGPLAPGSVEKRRLSGAAFKPGVRYWFVVRAVDEAGNDGGIGMESFPPSALGWMAFNPNVLQPRVLPKDFGKSFQFTHPNAANKKLVLTPGYLADTGKPDSGTPDKVGLPAGSLDSETVPQAVLTFWKGGSPINLDSILGKVKVDGVTKTGAVNTLTVAVNPNGSLPDIQIGDRSGTKVGEEAAVPDQVDITFPALPGFTMTRYNDVYPPSKPGDVENTVIPVVDAGAGTITGSKGTVEPFSSVVFYGQNPAGKTRAELATIEIKTSAGRANGAPYSAFASTTSDTNGGFPTTVIGNGNSYVYVVVKDAAGNLSPAFSALLPPTVTELDSVGPNPLVPSKQTTRFATVWFNLKETTKVKAVVFNADGELVKTLLDDDEFDAGWGRTRVDGQPNPIEMARNGEQPPAGAIVRTVRAVSWDGTNEAGKRVASGLYLVRFEAGGVKTTKKMLVIQ